MKVLSPEICHIALGQGLLHSETSIATHDSGECVGDVPGSEAMVGHSKTLSGTWEGHIVPDIEASNEAKKEVFWCFATRGKVAFRLRLMGLVQKH